MNASIARYYKRKKMVLACETVTPMFLGNPRQEAEWRAAPFKALLRYWWRVTQRGHRDEKSLLQAEGSLFGCAGEKTDDQGGKSLVSVSVASTAKAIKNSWPVSLAKIEHPETNQGQIDPLLYLAGMGLMEYGKPKHSFFPPESPFVWTVDCPGEVQPDLEAALAMIQAFGALGARCRNGWGSFQITSGMMDKGEAAGRLNACTEEWKTGFDKDYPNRLGKYDDDKRLLLWKTECMPTWEGAMRELADAYVAVRVRTVIVDINGLPNSIPCLDPRKDDMPAERHLLGFPLTHHEAKSSRDWKGNANWGKSGRHASPLRFFVKRGGDKYTGFILHLPHSLSKKMNEKYVPTQQTQSAEHFTIEKQIEVWEKVHKKLNKLLSRATYEECL
ncbi:MAG: hypothetical protein Q8O04_07480 [Deltaproteobacteria bacterium]|nr:hypothetical protein [Deltaproteobacteria bacterium]